jgi:glycosyltransferase involved in cell wall biosynthesis
VKWTVLVCTRDRAELLGEALASIAQLEDPGVPYEVVVVDNDSRDETRAVVERAAAASPVPLRYLFEPRGGVSAARNTGIAASAGDLIAFTDDDVRVEPGWLAALHRAAIAHPTDVFFGGPVLPRWGAPRPAWLPPGPTRGEIWGPIALLDYGDQARPLINPLGANMAFRRAALVAVGGLREDLGRDAGSLRSQGVPELMLRLRAGGAGKGWYVPDARVHHWVPPARLTKQYFRRWFFWKGLSRALLEQGTPVDEVGCDFRSVPRIAWIPRYMFRQAAVDSAAWALSTVRGDPAAALAAEVRLWYLAGYARAAWHGRFSGGTLR